MSAQEIKVDVFGRPIAAYIETAPVNLRVLGAQRIERFTQILHDEDEQRFYILFDKAAPYRAGRSATYLSFNRRDVVIPVNHTPSREDPNLPMFDSYADAIKAEQALLSAMLRTGEV